MKKFIATIIASALLISIAPAKEHTREDVIWNSQLAFSKIPTEPAWTSKESPWIEDDIVYVIGKSGWAISKIAARNLALVDGANELTKHDDKYSNLKYNTLLIRDAWVEENDKKKHRATLLLFSEPLALPLIPDEEANNTIYKAKPISKQQLKEFSEEIAQLNAQVAQQQIEIDSSEARALKAANKLADEMREEVERRVKEAEELSEAKETEEVINNTRNIILGGVTLGFLILLL
jgi:hypothetical protein